MPRATYGPKVKQRTKRLLAAILAYVNDELGEISINHFTHRWVEEASKTPKLRVKTTLQALRALSRQDSDEGELAVAQIREALYRMEDFLGIRKGHNPHEKGSAEWHFDLTLWSRQTQPNLEALEQRWEEKRPRKSKATSDTTAKRPVHTRSRPRVFQAPPLPPFFVKRPTQQKKLKTMLLAEQNTLVVSAVYGLGGIGKSVVATALAHDDDVQSRFVDGILWVTLGQEPDILPLLSGWIQALGDHNYKPTTTDAASMHLRTLLYGQQVLLVVDDVWNPDHAEPFRVGDAGSCVLVTTREAKIRKATRYDLGVMSPPQAQTLLEGAVPKALSTEQRQKAQEIAKAVGYLPLALELVAVQIEEGVSWEELLDDLCGEIAKVESLDRLTSRDEPDEAKRRDDSLEACFNLSLKGLTPEQLEQFAWLGILPEDISVSAQMVANLWQLTPKQAGAVLRTLRGKALLLEGVNTPEGKPTYRMHDLMHDRAVQLLAAPSEPQGPDKLTGLGLMKAQAHQQLLERYRSQTTDGQWHTLKDDSYIHSRLSWHFAQAERPDWLHELLQETDSGGKNGWYEACDRLGQTANFVTDVGRAWTLAAQAYETQPTESIVLQWRYALITTTLNSLAQNIPPELIARFVRTQFWSPAQGLAYVCQAQQSYQRAAGIEALAQFLPQALFDEALETARNLQDESYRASALSALAPHLPESLFDEALETARNLQDESYRASALSALAPHLPESLFDEALETARNLQDESYRASALSALAPHLPESLFDEALETARNLQAESYRASALSALAPHLPESLFDEALETARNLQDEYSRAWALSALAPHGPESLFDEALETARNLQAESSRARALSALAPHLPESLFDEALETARNLQDEYYRAWALSALAPHGPESLFDEALETARNLQDESSRARALSALAPHLPESLFDEALETARNLQDEYSRARALSALAPHGPESLFDEALETARNLQDESYRARALSALAPHLPESLFDEALETARNLQDESSRARALSALAPHLPESLFDEALETARNLQDESYRASALSALAPHLPESLFDEALETARNLQDESYRARALSALAPHLPESLFDEALETARNLQDESSRARALSALAPHLPESLFDEALETARNLQDESYRASALSALAPHLPESLFDEALETARNLQDESYRARALSALAPHLPESLFDEALETARNLQDESYRARALSALAPHLPESLFDEALETARNLQDESYRARALSALAPHLPESLFDEALETARNLQDESYRARALSALAPHGPESLFDEALETARNLQDEYSRAWALSALAPHGPESLFDEALETARNLQDEYSRAWALSALAPHGPESLFDEALETARNLQDEYSRATALQGFLNRLQWPSITFWQETLKTLATQDRKAFVSNLPQLEPAIAKFGRETALVEIVQAMKVVCAQWN
jgi:histidine ammonia-lyase